MFTIPGNVCYIPRQAYTPSDLPAEYHPALRDRFLRAARRDILPNARTREERLGLEERCEEVASAMYLHWLQLRSERIARGDHSHAAASVIRQFRLTGWHGMTGYRRSKSRKATAELLAWKERRRQALQDTPAAVAEARERISGSPMLARQAYRLATRAGMPGGVPALLRLATLAEVTERGHYTPAPAPAPVPGMHREGIVNATRQPRADGLDEVTEPGERVGGVRHYVRLRG